MVDDRAEVLARRVRWLDRYRRRLAIAVALALALTMMVAASWLLDGDWPVFYTRVVALMVGVIAWWLVEVAFAWIAALWETAADRLLRDSGLPPMRVVIRK